MDTSMIIKTSGQRGGAIQLTTGQKEILSLIEKDTQISKRQLAQFFLKIIPSTMNKHIESLKSKGVWERILKNYFQKIKIYLNITFRFI
jgi:predicted HTH transcriptional regulator